MYVAYWFNPDNEYMCAIVAPHYAEWMLHYGHYIRSVFMVPGTIDLMEE